MFRQVNKLEKAMKCAKGRRRYKGRFCPCCCKMGRPQEERLLVARSRRRLDKAIIEAELALHEIKS